CPLSIPPRSPLSPYTTLFRSKTAAHFDRDHSAVRSALFRPAGLRLDVPHALAQRGFSAPNRDVPGPYDDGPVAAGHRRRVRRPGDRKSTRLNSSHVKISYAVF